MLTLSVREAQAYYIVAGLKSVENRTWRTEYRGPLLIHASGFDGFLPDPLDEGPSRLPVGCEFFELEKSGGDGIYWRRDDGKLYFLGATTPEIAREIAFWEYVFARCDKGLATQAIIGKVDLVDIVSNAVDPWAEKGCWHWVLTKPVWFDKPVLGVAGKVKPFDFPEEKLPTGWR